MLSDRFTADSKAEPNEPPCFPRDGTQRRLIREVKSTARGSYRPSTPDTPFLADQRGPSRPNHQNLHTRMAAGGAFALPSDKPPNGRGNDLPRPAVRLDRVLFTFTRARNGALGYFWTLWAQTEDFSLTWK